MSRIVHANLPWNIVYFTLEVIDEIFVYPILFHLSCDYSKTKESRSELQENTM